MNSRNYTSRRAIAAATLLFFSVLSANASSHPKIKNTLPTATTWSMTEPDMLPTRPTADCIMLTPEALADITTPRLMLRSDREGIDVSHYQGHIDWQRVASEGQISYAYLKCTEGATIQDEYYRRNVAEARRAGLAVGCYHFYRPASSPEEQLANMTTAARRGDMDLVPIIDIEQRGKDSDATFLQNLRRFVEAVEKHYGKRPMLYTGQNFYNRHLAGQFCGYTWMIAKYIEEVPILSDNHDYAFWQFTSKARVPGIQGNVDRSCIMEGHSLEEIIL